ncbi:glycosyltransferase [Paraburkholderia tropica]|uniref:glycosyltransferase n=1 Tax=Paraburkholderia tropica TaxID=92647 RepID=UPI000D75C7FA|nr:glycosyltransferase [Paraburkholderia tropica]MBB2997710.1 glycosyltransferase involved in cell wall biosynthesis [Paraburkholderia tropica]MBB6316732.1 glycosyltransferase involved in cell wall biosynthesis [Paraburkholderia tropica]
MTSVLPAQAEALKQSGGGVEHRIDVSVIIPVYNCEPWLEAQLTSVLGQDGVEIEVIAVCDGATDRSLAILQAIAAQDRRVRVIAQENRGVSASRNVGLSLARGDWIVFADGDDWIKPGALRRWIAQGRDNDLDVVIGNGFAFDALPAPAQPSPMYEHQPWGEVCDGRTWMMRTIPDDDWAVCVWLQCMRREFIERFGLRFEEGVVHEDIIWTLQFAQHAQRMGFVKDPLYGYRRNPDSIINSPSDASLARRATGYLRVIDALVNAARTLREDRPFHKLLLRQVNREGGNYLHLLRKRLQSSELRRQFALTFINKGYVWVMLRGATNASEVWRALRCWRILSRLGRLPESKTH